MGPYISKENQNKFHMNIDSTINNDECIVISNPSHDYKSASINQDTNKAKTSDAKTKQIDKEHITIERIFRISLEESEKFLYLEFYLAQLLSLEKEIAFRIGDLDEFLISIINHPERKPKILEYLFETYHRAVEMIEKRFKNEYDSSYKNIRKIIANYITLVMYTPENFQIKLSGKQIHDIFRNYLKETDDEELGFFLMDIYNATLHDLSFLSSIFGNLFEILHEENIESKANFFNMEKIKKNLLLLTSLFEKCPLVAQAFVQEAKFIPTNIPTAKHFQLLSYMSPYLSMVSFESDIQLIRTNLPLNKSPLDMESLLKSYGNKLNDYLGAVANFVYSIYSATEICRTNLIQWMYTLINLNFNRTKLYQNNSTLCTTGFMLNTLILLLKIFLDQHLHLKINYHRFIFKTVEEIDPLFTLSNNKINFSKLDRINQDIVKEIVQNESNSDEYNVIKFNLSTQLFFIIQMMIGFIVKSFDDEINFISNKIEEMTRNNLTQDSKYKDTVVLEKAMGCYTRNAEFNKNLLRFAEITSVFIFTLNNTKYPQVKINQIANEIDFNYTSFLEDFFYHIDTRDNFALSLLPVMIPKNIIQSSLFVRKYHSDVLMSEFYSTKAIVYLSVIFSSHVDLIKNPHLRSEILDILIYFFIVNPYEKNMKISGIFRILNEEYIRKNLFYSLMRVFIDAERLGTSNQFYEKFSVRHKILFLIDNIMKGNKAEFVNKMKDYANNYKEDASKMINLLMNDITFLNDECIERLMDIKRYEDLKDDTERYSKLDEETKKFEEDKFKDNDRRIRTELKLFNSSMEFMVNISKICQENFIAYKLAERLANLLNYSLDVFTSHRGLKLKVKNKKEYGFSPSFVLSSLISTYSAFVDYDEFLEYVVKDERSYKYNNFEKAISIKESKKIQVNYVDYEKFLTLVSKLKGIEEKIKSMTISYEDADEEFFDPITTLIMEDPVLLPNSKVILDRKTIETHLMSDPTDPFNRSSLTKEMLIPEDELRNRIQDYLKKKHNLKA